MCCEAEEKMSARNLHSYFCSERPEERDRLEFEINSIICLVSCLRADLPDTWLNSCDITYCNL